MLNYEKYALTRGNDMKRSTLATLSGLLGYSIFGFSFLFSKVALGLTTPLVLLSVRFLTAFLVMNLLVLTGKMRLSLGGKPVRMLLLLGLVQPVVYFICENYGIALTSASFSGIMLGIIPIAGLVLGRLFLKEPCSTFQVACALLSIVGVALTSAGGEVRFSLLGTVLLAGAAVSAARGAPFLSCAAGASRRRGGIKAAGGDTGRRAQAPAAHGAPRGGCTDCGLRAHEGRGG